MPHTYGFDEKPVEAKGVEDIRDINVNTQGAQMLEARQLNKGDVANMFGIPGVLLEYSAPGSSLTSKAARKPRTCSFGTTKVWVSRPFEVQGTT